MEPSLALEQALERLGQVLTGAIQAGHVSATSAEAILAAFIGLGDKLAAHATASAEVFREVQAGLDGLKASNDELWSIIQELLDVQHRQRQPGDN